MCRVSGAWVGGGVGEGDADVEGGVGVDEGIDGDDVLEDEVVVEDRLADLVGRTTALEDDGFGLEHPSTL